MSMYFRGNCFERFAHVVKGAWDKHGLWWCKVDGSRLLSFPSTHFLLEYEWLATPNRGHNHFPHNFSELIWISYSLPKRRFKAGSYRSRQIISNIEPRMVIIFLSLQYNLFSNISFSFWYAYVPGATPYHISLKLRCPNKKSTWIRVVYFCMCSRPHQTYTYNSKCVLKNVISRKFRGNRLNIC